VNASDRTAEVDHEAIPGFMDAMTMAYPVTDERVLASLSHGDEVTADVVVVNGLPHLENIVILKRASKN
jgi:protein SCO1